MEIILPDYKKIAAGVEKREVFVEEKEVEDVLRQLQYSRAKFTFKNQPARKGDFLEIEYRSAQIGRDGQKDTFILGQGHFLQGFEENLIGMKRGEKKNIVLKKDGKNIEVGVEIKAIQNIELPEIGDEFAKSLPRSALQNNEPKKENGQKIAFNLGGFENLADLKKDIKERLNSEKKQAETFRQRNEILEKINQGAECEIPDELVIEEQKQMLGNFQNWVKESLKIPFEEYLNKIKKTEKEILDFFSVQARKKIKNILILKEIAMKEGVDPAPLKHNLFFAQSAVIKRCGVDPGELKGYAIEEAKIERIFQILDSFTKS